MEKEKYYWRLLELCVEKIIIGEIEERIIGKIEERIIVKIEEKIIGKIEEKGTVESGVS